MTILKKEVHRLQKELDLEKSRVFDESSIATNATYVITKSIEMDASTTTKTKKRNRSESNDSDIEQPPKVFIKSISRDEKLLQSLQEQIEMMRSENEKMKVENQNLKLELRDCSGEMITLNAHNDFLKNQLKEDAQRRMKFQQKIRFLKEKYFQKKEEIATLKSQLKSDEAVTIDHCDISDMYKNLVIFALEQKILKFSHEKCESHTEIIDVKNLEISQLNNQINVLKHDNYAHQVFEEKLKEQLDSTLNAYTIMQSQLNDAHHQIVQLTNERDEMKQLNDSLRMNFKASLTRTREQYQSIVEQKQKIASDYREQLKNSRNEELRNYLRLQDHFEKQCNKLMACNKNQKCRIEQLETKLNTKSIIDDLTKDRKHEHEKIKFIKQQFEMKLCEKVNSFEKLLIEKEKELSALKNMTFNKENNCVAFGKVLITN